MYYDLKVIPKLEEFIHSTNKKELANSLNLKYIYWNHKNKCNYHILKYDKQWLNKENNKSVGLLRSVIFDDEGNLVCFSPPKSLDVSSLVIDKNENVQAEKFVEGTMINVFYNKKTESWEMATKSSVGGESCFFMQDGFKIEYTFKYMFDEVCNSIDFDINSLKKDYCYSFVMQHPKNRIVKIISTMKLYLVEVYEIQGLKVNIVPFSNLDINKKIIIPDKISINNSNDFNHCKETLASMNTNYQVVGVVLKNKHGERFKIRNPNYEHVKKLRGNQPKLQYQYLMLRQKGLVKEYLTYYKEHKVAFTNFRNLIHDYTNQLYINYRKCYVLKEKELKEFPKKFKIHMYHLHHNLYLNELLPIKKFITKEIVIEYFNTLHPSKQMFVLNFDARKDFIKNEKQILENKLKETIES
tara:strand:- start:9794 stop:11029 length:1236 start_codon:yes stop_codon:yes gene_type:complete